MPVLTFLAMNSSRDQSRESYASEYSVSFNHAQILGGYVLDAFLTPWTLLIKALGLALAVASGLSLGKEASRFSRHIQEIHAHLCINRVLWCMSHAAWLTCCCDSSSSSEIMKVRMPHSG